MIVSMNRKIRMETGIKFVELNPMITAENRRTVIGRDTKRNMNSLNLFIMTFISKSSLFKSEFSRVLAGVLNLVEVG